MVSFKSGTSWRRARTGAVLCVFALLGGSSVTIATGQTPGATALADAKIDLQSSIQLYRTWQSMAGQVSQRLARANARLSNGPVTGLMGKKSFVADHMAVLEQSVKVLEKGANVPGPKLKTHQTQVLAFLNRATEIARLLNDLERSEGSGQSGTTATLRKNISALAGERLFSALKPSTPAHLRTVLSSDQLTGIYEPDAVNGLKFAIDNTGDETATDIAVTISPTNALIASVSDGQGSCTSASGTWRCRTATLGGGQQWPISVTLRHATPRLVEAGAPILVGMRVATGMAGKPPQTTQAATSFSYQVGNCQANFRLAIADVGGREGAALRAALRAMQSGAESLNGSWIAQPQSAPSTQLGKVFTSAAGIVEARGGDPWFTTTKTGRATVRMIDGLGHYLTQTKPAAQCSSARQIVAAGREILKPFYQRKTQVKANRMRALRAATATVAKLERLAGQPAQGTPAPSDNARALLARLDAALDPDAGQDQSGASQTTTQGEPDLRGANAPTFSRLEVLSARLPDQPGAMGETLLQGAKLALASIEASVYFELAEARYNALQQSLEATFAALLAAQNASCVCKSGTIIVSTEKTSAPTTSKNSATKHAKRRSDPARRVVNPPGPRPKPIDLIQRLFQARQPIINARAAARAAKKHRAQRLGATGATVVLSE
ncbi:MAG: hypothetical protein ACTSY1_01460 [Alphaproteobacteria bacterium]